MQGNCWRWLKILLPALSLMMFFGKAEGFANEALQAPEASQVMSAMTVTAERFPVEEIKTPRFVTIVSAEELRESGANNLADALKRVGGFAYKAYAPLGISHGGMNSKVAVRGLYDGELVLLNGAPIQGSASHVYDLNTIPLDQIERIEVLKGAASTLYGADAMTGVINIITKKTTTASQVRAAVEIGNQDYHNHTFSASLPGVNLGLNYQHLGEQREISRSFSNQYRYDLDPSDKFSLNLNANPLANLYFDYLGSYYESGFQKNFNAPGKKNEGTDQEHHKHFADLRYESETIKAKLFGSFDEMRRDVYTSAAPEDKNRSFNYGLSFDYRVDLQWADWLIGVDYTYFGADYNNKYGYHYRNDYALFSQLKKEFFDYLTLTLGVRQQFIEGEPGTNDYNRFLPSLGLDFEIDENLHLFANLGKAFRSPGFNDLYYQSSFMVGNPQLDPEEGWTYEAGLKYDNRFCSLRLAAFFMDYQDKIEIDRSQGYPLSYFNAGDYQSFGSEWELAFFPFADHSGMLKRLSAYASGYWADPEAEDAEGQSYRPGPKLQSTVGLKFLGEKFTLDLNSQTLAGRERGLESYSVVNFYGRLQVGSGFLSLVVDNLFAQEVQVSGDMSADAANRYLYYDLDGPLVKVGYEIIF